MYFYYSMFCSFVMTTIRCSGPVWMCWSVRKQKRLTDTILFDRSCAHFDVQQDTVPKKETKACLL